jgi:hypothetical protein
MSENAEPGTPAEPPIEDGHKGVVIGLLVLVLIALVIFFFWRGTGVRDDSGRHPQPTPVESR